MIHETKHSSVGQGDRLQVATWGQAEEDTRGQDEEEEGSVESGQEVHAFKRYFFPAGLIMKYITVPNKIKVIKNGNKYFSSIIEKKRHIYSFADDETLNSCCSFIQTFKKRYKSYPIMNETIVKRIYNPYDHPEIRTDYEATEYMQRMCHMYGVGLVIVDKFDYEFKVKNVDINISIADILPEIDPVARAEYLNYALILS